MADGKQAEVDVKGLKEEKIPTKLDGQGHEVFFDIDGVPEKLYVGDSSSAPAKAVATWWATN